MKYLIPEREESKRGKLTFRATQPCMLTNLAIRQEAWTLHMQKEPHKARIFSIDKSLHLKEIGKEGQVNSKESKQEINNKE